MSQKPDSRVRARPTRSLWWRTIGVAGIASICSVLAVPDATALPADPRASHASAVGLVADGAPLKSDLERDLAQGPNPGPGNDSGGGPGGGSGHPVVSGPARRQPSGPGSGSGGQAKIPAPAKPTGSAPAADARPSGQAPAVAGPSRDNGPAQAGGAAAVSGSAAKGGSPAQGGGSAAVSGVPRTDAPSQTGSAPAVTGLPRSDAANHVGGSPAAGVPPGRVKPGILASADQLATGSGANLSPVLKKAAAPGPVAGAADPSAQLMAKYRDPNAVGPPSLGGPQPQAGLPNKPGDLLNPDAATSAALAPRPIGNDSNAVGASAACVDPVKGCNQSGQAVTSTGTNWREAAHTTADLASFIPGLNVPAGLYNTVSYGAEGRTGEALLSAATIIPGGKWVTTAAKGAFKAFKLWKDARAADKLAVAAKGVDDVVETAGRDLTSARSSELAPSGPAALSGEPLVDRAAVGTTISPQRQGRHVLGAPQYGDGGFFRDQSDAQKVLDAFHNGSAKVLDVTKTGQIKVKYPAVTGFNNNPRSGYSEQPTDVFLIKGTKSVSVVPTTPN